MLKITKIRNRRTGQIAYRIDAGTMYRVFDKRSDAEKLLSSYRWN